VGRGPGLTPKSHGPRTGTATLSDVATRKLYDAILAGELAPGRPLRLEELAASLGMSTSPVRDAIRRLQLLGFAEQTTHCSARVRLLDTQDFLDMCELRTNLESLALRKACASLGRDDLAEARLALAALEDAYEAHDPPRSLSAHKRFHFALYRAAGSSWLLRLIEPVFDNCDRYRATLLPYGAVPPGEREGHEQILSACAHGDGDGAAAALEAHLSVFVEQVRARLTAAELQATSAAGTG
jgi:DNA-binding GntR family transcriptional regulator